MNLIVIGSLASLAAGLLTFVGALPVLLFKSFSDKAMDTALGFSAGIMLAATSFSLIIPSIEMGGGGVTGALICAGGFGIGGLVLFLSDRVIPHEHFIRGPAGPSSSLRRMWLFVFAITIHNFPEGLAVGVGYGGGDLVEGTKLAFAIGVQNMPEGLAVAVALLREGYPMKRALLVALLSGLVEPIGGILGISIVTIAEAILPWGLAFAAGSMLWVISHEIIPETHRRGFENNATTGVMIGFAVMMVLDNVWV